MRHEPKTRRTLGSPLRVRMQGGGRSSSARGQTTYLVEPDFVGRRRSRLEAFDDDERVVVPFDVEGARAMSEHADLARLCRLDPDRRRLGPYVSGEVDRRGGRRKRKARGPVHSYSFEDG